MGRRERDAYYTPEWATATLIERAPEIRGETLLDPCCGDGRMASALAARFKCVRLNDLYAAVVRAAQDRPELAGKIDRWIEPFTQGYDATDSALYRIGKPSWVVTNPPFAVAGQIAWEALQHALRGVALLLRITFLEPTKGRLWLLRCPPTRVLVLPRIDFIGAGSVDSATCAWFIWERGADGEWKRGGIDVSSGDAGQLGLEVSR